MPLSPPPATTRPPSNSAKPETACFNPSRVDPGPPPDLPLGNSLQTHTWIGIDLCHTRFPVIVENFGVRRAGSCAAKRAYESADWRVQKPLGGDFSMNENG
jgi:hypothetical protein